MNFAAKIAMVLNTMKNYVVRFSVWMGNTLVYNDINVVTADCMENALKAQKIAVNEVFPVNEGYKAGYFIMPENEVDE